MRSRCSDRAVLFFFSSESHACYNVGSKIKASGPIGELTCGPARHRNRAVARRRRVLALALISFRLRSLYSTLRLTMVLTARSISSSDRPENAASYDQFGIDEEIERAVSTIVKRNVEYNERRRKEIKAKASVRRRRATARFRCRAGPQAEFPDRAGGFNFGDNIITCVRFARKKNKKHVRTPRPHHDPGSKNGAMGSTACG